MNRNWRLDTDKGSFALKELLDVSVSQARRNLAILTPLAKSSLPAPVPISSVTGELVVRQAVEVSTSSRGSKAHG